LFPNPPGFSFSMVAQCVLSALVLRETFQLTSRVFLPFRPSFMIHDLPVQGRELRLAVVLFCPLLPTFLLFHCWVWLLNCPSRFSPLLYSKRSFIFLSPLLRFTPLLCFFLFSVHINFLPAPLCFGPFAALPVCLFSYDCSSRAPLFVSTYRPLLTF